MQISIIGHYTTKFGELWDKSLRDLLYEAMDGAINQAQIEPKKIEAIFIGNMAAGSFSQQRHLNALASEHFKHFPPAIRVESACASGSLALITAEHALLAKQYQTVLVVGVEKMTDVDANQTTEFLAGAADFEKEFGSTFPGLYALLANMHMQKFGTTREALSSVAVKNHRHAMSNPTAQFHKEFTIDQISNSPLIASPLRVLDCSPISDGASSVILTTKKVKNKPKILGFGQGQDTLDLASRKDLTSLLATTKAAKQAFKISELTHKKIEAAEVHDCFTIAELLAIEDLGFVEKGQAGPMTLAGQTTVGGKIVINPSGGLKACGHPIGATGVKQVAYLTEQLNKEIFNFALTHNIGGSGATAIVHILGK